LTDPISKKKNNGRFLHFLPNLPENWLLHFHLQQDKPETDQRIHLLGHGNQGKSMKFAFKNSLVKNKQNQFLDRKNWLKTPR
jgi:hypothetical protein